MKIGPQGDARTAISAANADTIVVRGHDVARVVGLMTGRRVEWEE